MAKPAHILLLAFMVLFVVGPVTSLVLFALTRFNPSGRGTSAAGDVQ